jgi:hypothetical protein
VAGTKKGIEGRRTPRRAFVHPVGILVGGRYLLEQALQLSEGGMLISAADKLDVAKQVVVTLVMPGAGYVVARGEIIYGKPAEKGQTHYGVKFASLHLNQRRAIRNYVTAKTQKEAEAEAEGDEGDLWGVPKNRLPS